MTDLCHNRLSVIGNPKAVKAFVEKAEGKDILWKYGKLAAYIGQVSVPFSFHSLVPLRPSALCGPYDPVGIDEERRQWGCKWGAFDTDFRMVEGGHAFYEFDTASQPPVNLLKTASGKFDVKFYASHAADVGKGSQRGRAIYYYQEIYALMHNVSPLTTNSDESPQNFTHRQELWRREYFDNHLEWVKGMMG